MANRKSSEWLLDMSKVQDMLDTLALALVNKIEREWPSTLQHLPFAQGFFGMTVRFSRITFRTVCYLCADARLKEGEWRWYYTLSLPALNRTMLDGVFNVVFMLEDIERRSIWYQKSGWREAYRDYLRYLDCYGEDPQWASWIEKSRDFIQSGVYLLGITPQDVKEKNWWPNPGKMIGYGVDANALSPTRGFLQYLNDWLYRETSAVNHQSFFGFLRMGGLLITDAPGLSEAQKIEAEEKFFPRHRAFQVSRSVLLLLCLISEVENYFNFGLAPRAIELWTLLKHLPEANEIYEKRYSAFWPVIGKTGHRASPQGKSKTSTSVRAIKAAKRVSGKVRGHKAKQKKARNG
jgi:hypothetical protein